MATFQSLPGFREFYPEDCAARNGLFNAWRGAARRHGFVEYDAPVLEPLELFTEKSGEEIRSQLFEFEDKGGRKVALRPEMTPSLARLVAARAGSLRRPVKWFSIGEMYRYEKPQKGRLRSFYQYNADILGEPGPGADAECIALLVESLKACGLEEGEFEIRINDRKFWHFTLNRFDVTENQIPDILPIIDKWERDRPENILEKLTPIFAGNIELAKNTQEAIQGVFDRAKTGDSPDITNWALDKSGGQVNEFGEIWNRLESLGIKKFVKLDPRIVRGLAYYTGFVFEAFQTVGTARALAGGGRYDNLLQKLGGVDLPAVGFAMGDVTMADLLQELKRPLGIIDKPDVYLVIGGAAERATALELVGKLRSAEVSVDYPLKDEKYGKQFKTADQVGAKLALILGPDEVATAQVKIKDMRSGVEIVVPNNAGVVANIREILEKGLPA